MLRSRIVEIAPFTLAANVTAEALLAASRRLETEVLMGMDGYVGRVLLQTDERSWTDLVFWRSKEAAEAMLERALTSEVCRDYFACMANTDADGVAHHRIIQGYGAIDI
jgi:sarcosine oxidase delta subunit